MDLPQVDAVMKSTASVRDKLKKRREALGSIFSGMSASAEAKPDPVATKKESETSSTSQHVLSKAEQEKADSLDEQPAEKKLRLSREQSDNSKKKRSNASTSSSSQSNKGEDILQSLLSAQSAKEKADQKQRDEIFELLGKPTAKEQSLIDKFRSQTGTGVKQFCSYSTKKECMKMKGANKPSCDNLHFAKIIQPHTEESLGDCSFLNTCFHMDTCKYIHYEVDAEDIRRSRKDRESSSNGLNRNSYSSKVLGEPQIKLVPPQWVQCDLRNLDLSVLGKFAVLMADPPWDIHMELPYGTMSDDEMRRLPIPSLQDEGLIFLWVTGRAMELGRECLKLWGYERVDEIIWVKTNQLQRIIRTGRTGHWLNHGKEHCLVGMKGNLKNLNRGLDCDVIVAEVRATSHKPDEIYGIIERLSPGTRKCELFGRPHNVQPNWVTLGNQLDGVVIHDEEMAERWANKYEDGYKMTEGLVIHARKEP